MKLLLLLLPLFISAPKLLAPASTPDAYTYELTVKSANESVDSFNLLIEGEKQTIDGKTAAFRIEENDLRTPYQLSLPSGRYVITTVRRSKDGKIISKVQGISSGRKMGWAASDEKKTTLTVSPGSCSARGEN